MTEKKKKRSGKITIPVYALVQDAIDIKHCCTADKEYLLSKKFDWTMVDQLESTTTACARAEACWNATKADCKDKTQQLRLLAKECYRLRSGIAKSIRDIARIDNNMIKLPWYSRSRSYSDIVQDLFELGRYCTTNRGILESAGFEMQNAENALEKSQRLAKMVACVKNESALLSPDLTKRDETYAKLKSLVLKVRQTAICALQSQPSLIARYRSSYNREHNNKRSKQN